MSDKLQTFQINAVTGEREMIDFTPEEIAEAAARRAAALAQQAAEAAATEAAATQAAADKAILDIRPSADDINKATTVPALKDLMLKQAAAIDVLVKRQGFGG